MKKLTMEKMTEQVVDLVSKLLQEGFDPVPMILAIKPFGCDFSVIGPIANPNEHTIEIMKNFMSDRDVEFLVLTEEMRLSHGTSGPTPNQVMIQGLEDAPEEETEYDVILIYQEKVGWKRDALLKRIVANRNDLVEIDFDAVSGPWIAKIFPTLCCNSLALEVVPN